MLNFALNHNIIRVLQECIPVGRVPSATVAYAGGGGVPAPGGDACSQGVPAPGKWWYPSMH